MTYFAGIDVSLEESSICVVDAGGKIVREVKVLSEPESLVKFFSEAGLVVSRIGLEAGPLSQWLHDGLTEAGFEVVLLETRHVKAALSAMVVKTDRKDARGIAQLLRMGWFQPVHVKSVASRDVRALLTARKLLQSKLIDVELSIRGTLRGFGLKMGKVSNGRFEARVVELERRSPPARHRLRLGTPSGSRRRTPRAADRPQYGHNASLSADSYGRAAGRRFLN